MVGSGEHTKFKGRPVSFTRGSGRGHQKLERVRLAVSSITFTMPSLEPRYASLSLSELWIRSMRLHVQPHTDPCQAGYKSWPVSRFHVLAAPSSIDSTTLEMLLSTGHRERLPPPR